MSKNKNVIAEKIAPLAKKYINDLIDKNCAGSSVHEKNYIMNEVVRKLL